MFSIFIISFTFSLANCHTTTNGTSAILNVPRLHIPTILFLLNLFDSIPLHLYSLWAAGGYHPFCD
jgi:hypothetical protein